MVLGVKRAIHRCDSLDSGIVTDFRVDSVSEVKDSLCNEEPDGFVNAIVGVSDDLIVGSVVGSAIIGSVIITLHSELSIFRFLAFSVVGSRAVAGSMINMPLIRFPARLQKDAEVREHFPCFKIVVYLPKSN